MKKFLKRDLTIRLQWIATIRNFIGFPVLLFATLSTAPFFWAAASDAHGYIGSADYLSPINILFSFHYSISPFNHLNAAGADQGFLLATIPLNFYYFILDQLGATPLFATITLLSLIIFVAQLNFYKCLRYFSADNSQLTFNNSASCTLGAILYGFSPYVIAMIIPGHFLTLLVYAAFPIIIRRFDSLIVQDKLDWAASIILFLVFALCAPGFANIGIIYVLLIACSIYFCSVMLVKRPPIYRSISRFSLLIGLLLLSNLWWLFPHLYNIKHYVAMSQSTATGMVQLVDYASKHATIANLFQGKPESMMYMFDVVGNNYYVNAYLSAIFLLSFLLIIIAALKKQPKVWVLLFAALASVMFVKGVQAPFSSLFLWAYDNVPGFQIFRRPVAKFNGFFLFFFLAGATLGLAILQEKYANIKWKRSALLGVAGVAAGYLVFIFTQTSSLTPFNIPDMYFKANKYLLEDQVERALIVPGTYGLNPVYRPAMNSYAGQDFTNDVFWFPKVTPDSTSNSLNEPYKIQTNKLMQGIREHNSICIASKALGISHIIVRDDLVRSQVEDSPRLIIATLDKHPEIAGRVVFPGGNDTQLVIYKIKKECTTKLLQLNGNYASFKYDFINPGKIILNIDDLKGAAELTFLNNFNKNWEVFIDDSDSISGVKGQGSSVAAAYNNPRSWKLSLNELLYAFRQAPFESTHAVKSQYANSWTLNPAAFKQSSKAVGNSSDLRSSRNIRLVLFYRPQAYFYLGTIISLVTLAILLLLGSLSNMQRNRKLTDIEAIKC